jgi:hypothetical protein
MVGEIQGRLNQRSSGVSQPNEALDFGLLGVRSGSFAALQRAPSGIRERGNRRVLLNDH